MDEDEVEGHVLNLTEAEQWILLGIPVRKSIHFKGKLLIKRVISGSVEILGFILAANDDEESGNRPIFSPKGYSLMKLSGFEDFQDQKRGFIDRNFLQKFQLPDPISRQISRLKIRADPERKCWMIVSKLEVFWTEILDECLPFCFGKNQKFKLFKRDKNHQGPLPEPIEKILDVNFYDFDDKRVRLFKENPNWESCIQSIRYSLQNQRQPRILLAGGKGVGKSTFLRYLTNRMLNESGPVLIIDLDPGQAEFTVPGCISVTLVARPLLGPNFTHLEVAKIKCLNLGEVNVSNIASRYRWNVSQLFKFCSGSLILTRVPWIVNTMGFTHGLGLKFMEFIFWQTKPSTVVELRSRFDRKNYSLNFETMKLPEPFNVLRYEAMPESTEAKDMGVKDLWGIPEPARLRDIVTLSYIGHLYMNKGMSGPLLAAKPYKISWKSISVQILHHIQALQPRDIPMLFNMSLVSLGVVPGLQVPKTENPWPHVIPCDNGFDPDVIGFGFIRGVDVQKRLFFVVTPLSRKEVKSVNCLTMGSVVLPAGIAASQPDPFPAPPGRKAPAVVPYCDPKESAQELNPLHAPWQRYNKPKGFDGR